MGRASEILDTDQCAPCGFDHQRTPTVLPTMSILFFPLTTRSSSVKRGEHILRNELGRYFDLQEESIGPPARKSTLEYLGGRLRKVDLANSVPVWAFGSCPNV